MDAPPFTLNAWLRYDLIERTLAGLDGVESILEIGAGRGALGARLATRYRYVGVEPDELSCEAAKEVLGRLGSGEMVCGDVSALPRTPSSTPFAPSRCSSTSRTTRPPYAPGASGCGPTAASS